MQFAKLVGDGLIRRRDAARGLDRLGGRRCGGGSRGRRRRERSRCRARRGSAAFSSSFRRLGLGGLRRIGHRRGGVQLEIAGGRGRDVGGFGTRDRRIDREFRGAAAGRTGLRQCRGRGHREEGRRDSHQHAVISSTVLRTVTHRHTPWAKLPRHGTVLDISSAIALSLQAPALLFEATFSNAWFALKRLFRVATPARNDSYADGTCAPLMQPAPRGATHDKLTSSNPFATYCALLPRSLPFVCHCQATVQMFRKAAVFGLFASRTPAAPQSGLRLSLPRPPPPAGSSAAASSSLR